MNDKTDMRSYNNGLRRMINTVRDDRNDLTLPFASIASKDENTPFSIRTDHLKVQNFLYQSTTPPIHASALSLHHPPL